MLWMARAGVYMLEGRAGMYMLEGHAGVYMPEGRVTSSCVGVTSSPR